MAIGLVVFCGG